MKKKSFTSCQFETKEEVEAYLEGDKISCLLCGKEFQALGIHLTRTHKVNIKDYKEYFGIPHGRGLTGITVRKKKIIANKKRPLEFFAEMSRKGASGRKAENRKKRSEYAPASKKAIQQTIRKICKRVGDKVETFCHNCNKKLVYTERGIKNIASRGLQPTCKTCVWKLHHKKRMMKKKQSRKVKI